jgi:hypothetical protein
MRSKEEIAAEIEALTAIKPRVPRLSFFREDNWRKIEAEIDTLQNVRDEDDVFAHFEEEHGLDADTQCPTRDAAISAAQWLVGDNDDRPSEGWKACAK